MSKQQYGIKCPKTGKTLTVSRDVYHALQHAQQDVKKKQSDMTEQLKKSGQALTKKEYIGSTKDIDVAVRFDESGKIQPTVELKNSLEHMDEKTRRIVQDTLYQFTECLNQTLQSKTDDLKKELEKQVQPAA